MALKDLREITMHELLNKEHTRIDTFSYQIGSEDRYVLIQFINGKFDRADLPEKAGSRSRSEWKILAEIEAEITRLEGEMKS